MTHIIHHSPLTANSLLTHHPPAEVSDQALHTPACITLGHGIQLLLDLEGILRFLWNSVKSKLRKSLNWFTNTVLIH